MDLFHGAGFRLFTLYRVSMFLDQSVQGTGIPIEPLPSHRHRQVQLLFVVFDPAEEIPETSICVGDVKLFLGDVIW